MTTTQTRGLPVADRRQTFRAIGRLLAGHRWRLSAILLLLAVAAAATLVLPVTIGWIVDTVTATDADGIPAAFGWQIAALVLAAVGGGVLEGVGVLALGRLVQHMTAELREEYVSATLCLPEAEFDGVDRGDVVTRAATDTRVLSDDLPTILPAVVAAGSTAVMIVIGTSIIDVRFLIAFAVAVPLYALALRWYLPAVPPVYAALRAADSLRGERVLTAVSALPTVVAFGAGAQQGELIRTATWDVARWEVRARIMQNRFFGRINVAELAGLVMMLVCGFVLAAFFGVSLGQVTAAALLFLQLTGPLAALLFVMDDVQSASAALARVVGVIDRAPGAPALSVEPVAAVGDPLLTVRDVRYGYRPETPVLHDISLTVHAGERLAIVGSSGSGKTTLAGILAGVREPDAGTITASIGPGRIASLTQETHVFAATLGDNLRLAAPTASESQLSDALHTVHADPLLALPGGLDAVLGDEGHRLTGAEAQLLALARLVLLDPALTILDEATAEADSRTAGLLADASAAALRERAAIVIAHQLEQARVCDRIVVLEHGRIVEEGTHDALLDADGHYARFWRAAQRPDAP